MSLDPDKYRLSEAEHQAIFDRRIRPHLFAGAKNQDQPTAVVFGGQPGAGKSASVDAVVQEFKTRGGLVQIIGDDMRGYHPKYGSLMAVDDKTAAFYTDKDTGRWVEKAIAHAIEKRVNLVIEGTMRDSNKVAETMRNLKGAGYEIDARVLAVNERLSWQGVLQRYENQKADRGSGRMTAPHSHEAAYVGMPSTIERIEREKLADRVTVLRRGADVIYSNRLHDGVWEKEPGARQAVEAERARAMTLQERREYAEGFDKLTVLMARPDRRASADELQAMTNLRTKAKQEEAAEAFRTLRPEEARKSYPELAGAYGVMAVLQKQTELDRLSREERTRVLAYAKENIANSIEQGEKPSIQLREEVAVERGRGADRG